MAVRSLNKVQLIGNLTRDPELRYTPQGTAVCSFGLATNRSWTTESGERREETEFHRIVAWAKLAELCSQLLFKGRRVYVEGRLQTRQWTAQDGGQRSTTEVIIDDMIILDSRHEEDRGGGDRGYGGGGGYDQGGDDDFTQGPPTDRGGGGSYSDNMADKTQQSAAGASSTPAVSTSEDEVEVDEVEGLEKSKKKTEENSDIPF